MRMNTSVPSYYKQLKKDRTFIINKQAPACPTTHHDKEGYSFSEVSAWLLHYVHTEWCDGPYKPGPRGAP